MSDLPPFEPDLRKQLARRASGRAPDDLMAGVRARLEIAPDRPTARRAAPRLAYGLAAAGMVALLSAAVVLPLALRPSSGGPLAGYPSQRALTAAELSAAVRSGLAITTPLVAQVTIDTTSRPCTWNRYPSIGAIEGAGEPICVLGYDLSARLFEQQTGVFAFRLLAPGVVGLIGEVQPASDSRLAFDRVPLERSDYAAGTMFVVTGWLTPVSCGRPSAPPGDVLNPATTGRCPVSVLSPNDPSEAGSAGPAAAAAVAVTTGGVRELDSIPEAATFGSYVLRFARLADAPASCASVDGCTADYWTVMARLTELSLPALPTASAQASGTPPNIWDPASRPLTAAELPRAMSVAEESQILVADVSILPGPDCPYPFDAAIYRIVGRIDAGGDRVCVIALDDGAAWHQPSKSSGVFAFRMLQTGYLAYMAEVDYRGSRGLAFAADENWPNEQTIVAAGWVVSMPASYPCPSWAGRLYPLDPESPNCPEAWLANGPMREDQARSAVDTGKAHPLALPYLAPDDPARPVSAEGVYLIRDEVTICRANDPDLPDRAACSWQIMGRIAPLALPPAAQTTATPTTAPPATPVAFAPGVGLTGPGGRPLTQAELALAWAADPNHLAGRIVITKGAVHSGFLCWDAGAADASAPLGSCNVAVLEGSVAPEGYWAVRVGSDGRLTVLGEVTMLGGLFVSTVPQLKAASLGAGQLVVVSGLLAFAGDACDVLPTLPGSGFCSPSSLEGGGAAVPVQPDAHASFGTGANPSADLYLVRWLGPGQAEVLARLETIAGDR